MAGGPKPKPDDVRGTSTVWKPIVTDSITEDKRGYTKGGHLVMCDDRESWNWQTHYKHIYVPQPQVRKTGSCQLPLDPVRCVLPIRVCGVRNECGWMMVRQRVCGHILEHAVG